MQSEHLTVQMISSVGWVRWYDMVVRPQDVATLQGSYAPACKYSAWRILDSVGRLVAYYLPDHPAHNTPDGARMYTLIPPSSRRIPTQVGGVPTEARLLPAN